MTKSTITRERATDKEIQMLIDSQENGTAMFMRTDAYYFMAKELQERRKADSNPLVSFYRDGIEAAAKWIDKQREAYDSEHGRYDTGTGFFEFGNDAQREYSSTLEELAEGIRALHPNAGNSPAIPEGYVMVPKEATEEMLIAGLEEADPLGSLIDWDASRGDCNTRKQVQEIFKAMLAAATQEVSHG